jgi:ABC-type polysaccharide/polyol phosphate export permease
MQGTIALNIPHSSPALSRQQVAAIDVLAGIRATHIWGRLGWSETKRRYRRTKFGPFWSTASIAIFVTTLGLVWSNLWDKDPKTYLPYLTAGMLCWVLFSTICMESASAYFHHYEKLIKQLRISYTLLACATVWRNVIVFGHNLIIYVLVCLYAGVAVTFDTLLVLPGFALMYLNLVWVSLFLGAVCARYRDLQQLVGNLLQIALFLTPIFWSVDQLKGRAGLLAELNPAYHLIALVREPLLGHAPAPLHWIAAIAITIVGWAATISLLSKYRHRIVYWL